MRSPTKNAPAPREGNGDLLLAWASGHFTKRGRRMADLSDDDDGGDGRKEVRDLDQAADTICLVLNQIQVEGGERVWGSFGNPIGSTPILSHPFLIPPCLDSFPSSLLTLGKVGHSIHPYIWITAHNNKYNELIM